MAQRKAPQVEPVLDNSAVNEDPTLEVSKVIKHLPDNQFGTVIRFVKTSTLDEVECLRLPVIRKLQEVDATRDMALARSRMPRGSDQIDVGSILTWISKIQEGDVESVNQLLIIDATIAEKIDYAKKKAAN